MAEKMTLEQVRDGLRLYADYQSTGGYSGKLLGAADVERMADALDAHLTQPAQAGGAGAEDRFEQYVKTLIDKAPDVQKLGERLAHLLDDDQFNNIEPTLLGIAAALADMAGEVRELVEDWRTAADAHAEIGYPACADVGRRCADELEAALAKFHPTHQEKP